MLKRGFFSWTLLYSGHLLTVEFQKELFKKRLEILSLVHIVGNEMESHDLCLTSGHIDTNEGRKKKGNESVSGTEVISHASCINNLQI